MPIHGEGGTIGKDKAGLVPKLFYEAEDVIPSAAIQPCGMVPEFKEDLIHFECGQDSLNQNRGPDRAARKSQFILRQVENVIPQAGLHVTLHLRKVEVWTGSLLHEAQGVVKKIKAEIKERG